MIRGLVNSRLEPMVVLRVRGPSGTELDFYTLVDTGFTGSLSLPSAAVSALGLVRQFTGRAVLADGSTCQFDVYKAEVAWDALWIPVSVSVFGDETLLGMTLLANHELRIKIRPGNVVEITPLP
jgi:clan AA aspartic protease